MTSTSEAGRTAIRHARRRLRKHREARRRPPADLTVPMVEDPVFILSSVRSGSTLLRVMLDSHSRITAPHELHFNDLRVAGRAASTERSVEHLKLSYADLQNLLWDRLLSGLLASSGKQLIVDKTPQNAAEWRRIHAFWPKARYIHLRRHPSSIVQSRAAARTDRPLSYHYDLTNRYGDQLDEARAALDGPTVRYEDLTVDPAGVTRRICDYLGVPWEASMLRYGARGRADLRPGLGDWSPSIRTGRVQPARPLPAPDDVPAELRPLAQRWGYL